MRKYLLIIVILAACSGKDTIPSDVLPPTKMKGVLWDMISAGEYYSSYLTRLDSAMNEDSARLATYSRVFGIHNIDKATFDRSYAWYKDHPAQMAVILDSLSKTDAPNNWQNATPGQPDTIRKKMLQRADIEVSADVQ
jgi:hypothetical protein